jgi:hypothetical protein
MTHVAGSELPLWAEADRRTNSLLVSGTAKDLDAVEMIVGKIDRPGEAAVGGRTKGPEGAKRGDRKPKKGQVPGDVRKGAKSKGKQGAGAAGKTSEEAGHQKGARVAEPEKKAGKAARKPRFGGKQQPIRAGKPNRGKPHDQGENPDGTKNGAQGPPGGKKRAGARRL